jgi:hypothetical protein
MPISTNATTATISGSTSSARTAYPAGNNNGVRVYNAGTVPVFIRSGDSTVAATTAGQFVPPASTVIFEKLSTDTHLAAITASSTATVYFSLCSSQQ